MRELKFRVWIKSIKEYDYSPYVYDSETTCEYDRVDLNAALANNGDAEGDGTYDFEQYTGLKDKNGKEIYEGDILYLPEGEDESEPALYRSVIFKDGCFGIQWDDYYAPLIDYLENWTVAGNIHENPELLRESNMPWEE